MNADIKPSDKEKETASNKRANLNNDDRKKESNAIEEHSDRSIRDVDRNLNEQMGGTDNTAKSEPNHI